MLFSKAFLWSGHVNLTVKTLKMSKSEKNGLPFFLCHKCGNIEFINSISHTVLYKFCFMIQIRWLIKVSHKISQNTKVLSLFYTIKLRKRLKQPIIWEIPSPIWKSLHPNIVTQYCLSLFSCESTYLQLQFFWCADPFSLDAYFFVRLVF